jgi:hypothetical protein
MNVQLVINELMNEHFVRDTLLQIQKDFLRCGWEFDSEIIEKRISKSEIEEFLANKLAEIMKHGESQLLQLIYIIDIPEKEFLKIVSQPNILQNLAEKILLKEAYKVYLRRKYS